LIWGCWYGIPPIIHPYLSHSLQLMAVIGQVFGGGAYKSSSSMSDILVVAATN
jgi:hypothetical protein